MTLKTRAIVMVVKAIVLAVLFNLFFDLMLRLALGLIAAMVGYILLRDLRNKLGSWLQRRRMNRAARRSWRRNPFAMDVFDTMIGRGPATVH